MQKNVLVFGAGKSATVLIQYLIKQASRNNWQIQVVDANLALVESKINNHKKALAFAFDIATDTEARQSLIANAAIVISLLPPQLHILVAKDCITYQRNLLTASYIDGAIKALAPDIINNKLLFLYEMGLDPGIDHMSAMQLIDKIHLQGGVINSFKSHCGGLVAPESDNNPWHYKISWNPRNIVMAGKAGAEYLWQNEKIQLGYNQIFATKNLVNINGLNDLAYYANRDSLSYIPIYNLNKAHTFIRTTLRHSEFVQVWNAIITLQLTNEEKSYDSNVLAVNEIFMQHIATINGKDILYQFMANTTIAKALQFLQLHTFTLKLQKGVVSIADVLQYCLEQKLLLQPADKDMIVMQHEIEYTIGTIVKNITSSLIVKGDNAIQTAMAKTVGLPLGIAATLILNGTITSKGLKIPISKEIFEPVLRELAKNGVSFKEMEC